MGIPKRNDIFLPLLKAIGVHGLEGKVLLKDLVPVLADHFGLTQDEQSKISTDGRSSKFYYAIKWVSTDLIIQGLIEKPEPGYRRITSKGMSELGKTPINPISGAKQMFGVLDIRPDSGIDNEFCSRHHFPRKYLSEMENIKGNWFVYREVSRGGGRHGYVAIATVARITPDPDPKKNGYYYAIIEGCKEFDKIVPFKRGEIYTEDYLNQLLPKEVGLFLQRNSVRTISSSNFHDICSAGWLEKIYFDDIKSLNIEQSKDNEELKTKLIDVFEQKQRQTIEMRVIKIKRDYAFRNKVMAAYEYTCAFTEIKINDGKEQYEAQAAHILPVADDGPDHVQNGIALSSTCHWLFDRHLISLTDDFRLLLKNDRMPNKVRKMLISRNKRIHLPTNKECWPDINYITKHRKIFESL